MKNNFKIFSNDVLGSVRVIFPKGKDNDEPWFVLVDVCKILEHSNPSMAAELLDDDEKFGLNFSEAKKLGFQHATNGVNVVNESVLYNLIFRSNKPQARLFKRWVTSEVLPAIRNTGSYQMKADEWKVLRQTAAWLFNVQRRTVNETIIRLNPDISDNLNRALHVDTADFINLVVFGMTAKDWREWNPDKPKGKNMRDYASKDELLMLIICEALNAGWMVKGIPADERFRELQDFSSTYLSMLKYYERYPEMSPGNIGMSKMLSVIEVE